VLKSVDINREPPKLGSVRSLNPSDRGVAGPIKQPPPHICYHIKFVPSASKGVHINRREPPKLGSDGPHPLDGRRGSKDIDIDINRGEVQILGNARIYHLQMGGLADPKKTFLPSCVILSNVVILR